MQTITPSRRTILLLLLGTCHIGSPARAQEKENYTALPGITCSTDDISILRNAIRLSDGAIGFNPKHHRIGYYAADKSGALETFMGKNWYPLRPVKQILRGKLTKLEIYDGGGDEMDWNIYILPDEAYNVLIEEAKPHKFTHNLEAAHLDFGLMNDNWHTERVNGKDKIVIEAEITPDENRYSNRWFPRNGGSPLTGRKICVYGPFVREEAHGNRPEIHPCEQIWWRDGDNAYYWMLVMDDSNRFKDSQDFGFGDFNAGGQTINIPSPRDFQPWVNEANLTGSFKIAFQLNPKTEVQSYAISVDEMWQLNRSEENTDADNGNEHAITFLGKKVITVVEPAAYDSKIGVTFENVCYNPQANLLQGYIVVTATVGNGEGKEGLLALRIDKLTGAAGEQQLLQWQTNAGGNTWRNLRTDETLTPLDDMRFSDFRGDGYVHGRIDFNGDSITDVFKKRRDRWQVSFSGTGDWETINTKPIAFPNMRFGDFNGDGKTDILGSVDGRWKVCYGGRGEWQNINSSVHAFSKLRVGDFDGDGSADVFGSDLGGFRFKVQYHGTTGAWINLGTPAFPWPVVQGTTRHPVPTIPVDQLRFGDFNGDGKTDVFTIYYAHGRAGSKDTWWVSWGGKTDWEKLRVDDQHIPLTQLFFGRFNSDRKTDILTINASGWHFSYGATGDWVRVSIDEKDPLTIAFGNFSGDLTLEAFRMQNTSRSPVTAPVGTATLPSRKPVVVKNRYIPGSLARTREGGKDALTMQVAVTVLNEESAAPRSVKMLRNMGANPSPAAPQTDRIRVDVSGDRPTRYEIETDDGEKFMQEIASFSITTDLTNTIVKEQVPASAAVWQQLKQLSAPSAASYNIQIPPGLAIVKASQFSFVPFYAPVRNKEVSPGEESPVTEEINEAIGENNVSKLQALFGTTQSFSMSWKIDAFDMQSKTRVAVAVNRSAGLNEVQVIITPDAVGKNTLLVRYPSSDKIYQVIVTATTKDSYGNTGTRSFSSWNVVCPVTPTAASMFIAANGAGTADFKAMVRAFATDGRYDFAELMTMIRAFR